MRIRKGDRVITKYGLVGIMLEAAGYNAVIVTEDGALVRVPLREVYKQSELDVGGD